MIDDARPDPSSPRSLARCELTHIGRVPIRRGACPWTARGGPAAAGVPGLRGRRRTGCATSRPDGFIEDAAIVLDELAVITRPGAASRQAETAAVASTLGAFRQLQFLWSRRRSMAVMCWLGRTLYVGVGSRTNTAGVEQLRDVAPSGGYEVRKRRRGRLFAFEVRHNRGRAGHRCSQPEVGRHPDVRRSRDHRGPSIRAGGSECPEESATSLSAPRHIRGRTPASRPWPLSIPSTCRNWRKPKER